MPFGPEEHVAMCCPCGAMRKSARARWLKTVPVPQEGRRGARKKPTQLKSTCRQSARACLLRGRRRLSDVQERGCVCVAENIARRAHREDDLHRQILEGRFGKLSKFYSMKPACCLLPPTLTSIRFVRRSRKTPETSGLHRGEGSHRHLGEREDPTRAQHAAWRAGSRRRRKSGLESPNRN